MSTTELELLKYPIGKKPEQIEFTLDETIKHMERIASLPVLLMQAVPIIEKEAMEYSYRPGGWSVAQIFHHLADSHSNMYIRIKLALTEENPTITAYNENLWAELPEAKDHDLQISVMMLSAIHTRLIKTLQQLKPQEFLRTYFHPAQNRKVSVAQACASYAWHGDHHFAQIKQALEKKY